MGYEELNSHYESLNKKSIEEYNNSYKKYLDNHEKTLEINFHLYLNIILRKLKLKKY